MHGATFDRRAFLGLSSGLLAASCLATRRARGQRPAVTRPRATDGDDSHQPDWDQRLVLTVGPKKADLVGQDDKVIQAAVDYVSRLGGGTVHVLPGVYTLRSAVTLASGVRLLGSGPESVLTKIPSESVELADDSDWYDQEVTLKEVKSFRVGDGVVFQAKNPHDGGTTVVKRTLIARSGNRFQLNDGLRENLWLTGKPTCSSLFPLLTSERTADVTIENIALDGNRANNENFNGNYGGCIFLQDCNRYTIRNVEARNYNGDGISFQVCHDVVVERCYSHHNANLGVHPGSGSQRPLIRDNRLIGNAIGIFWCWGVKYGLAEKNRIDGSLNYGISIGHCDTDNVMRDNDITNSGKVGILFRDPTGGRDFWPHRNVLENNRIVNSGGTDGVAIDLRGKVREVRITGNQLRETRGAADRVGIRIGSDVGAVVLSDNLLEGFSQAVQDMRQA